ncbi:excinuclease ABC subunit UvrC [Pseudobacteriovorax antillogorgiicola]|uniref:UvrABC system protein C n=1 Tax=Pseudobacteriovorax antillogorgiicola TaxID=1513793 RepID=A0A1Y6BZ77_9BACT|nr:excinuclease ABC subunit UvrC [Pseudobacteriovorax antillogorgiicola]TCS50258.1 excinuclease ABC subunit C [Pseudobacteriovorax antillogorgiicola]SMF33006.1 Excinuclease ABC subunit C [Pseudobacteriovorax antillogorgiicola]
MSLREKIEHLPKSPGVYFMKNCKGKIIYVGKAKNLKSRVSSYFQSRDQHIKTRALVDEIKDFDLMITKTEVEALLLERSMIRHHQPYYNILLRDDKEYPFVRVDFNDPWPRIQKVRKRKDDGAKYVGPFGNAGVLNGMLKTVFRVFPLIRCSPYEFKNAKRPCNYYHMKMCLGPCVLDVSRDEYVAMVRQALDLLDGKNRDVKAEIRKKMFTAAQDEKFEQAARYRDQITLLESIGQHQAVVVKDYEDADAIGSYESAGTMTFNVTMVRNFVVIASDSYSVGASIDGPEETLESFLLQYYHNRTVPDHLILPLKLENPIDLVEALCVDQETTAKFVSHGRGDAKDLLELASRNARFYFDQNQNLQLKQKAELEILQSTLQLDRMPRRMECIDISNMQGSAIVASDVCFVDGKPAKDLYRRYNIKTVSNKNDDFASIREVVERRLERGVREDDLPDLLVIDGGKGQLNAALEAAQSFAGLSLPIVALAKSRTDRYGISDKDYKPSASKERIFIAGQEYPIELQEGSPAHRLMTRIRDEAHRFAITFHRQKRQKSSHASILDEVPGVGPVLRKRLIQQFGDVDGIRRASLEQLQEVKGLQEKTAVALYTLLKSDSDKPS